MPRLAAASTAVVELLHSHTPASLEVHERRRARASSNKIWDHQLLYNSMVSAPPTNAEPPKVIAERYSVEAVLGRGGMAVVYRAHDRDRLRPVALKRLLGGGASEGHVARLFELEYHTLSQLAHPRIIEVYDYDTDDQGPFYTMELLTGGDLRQRSPVPWRECCRLLSDVCSALALIHSRRLVHRDLTPLNVRCTSDWRAKLFDFGSMAPFGRTKHIVGTPPFIAPEALNGEALDGQTDLYALGATAYYALTKRHAYPARTLAELPDLWSRVPPAPSKLVADIPAALDALIMALLHQVPSARPALAAEVMERLSAIGGFEIQEALLVSDSYLSTPSLVGRNEQVAAFTRRLHKLSEGRGAAMHVHGQPGSGRSRLLDACALQAKLGGRPVLRVDAGAVGLRRWGGVSRLLEQIIQLLPEQSAKVLAAHAAVLAPVMPATNAHPLGKAMTLVPQQTTAPSHGQAPRAELQTALRDVLRSVGLQRPLVLVVDDLDRLDEPSAAFFALLGHSATEHRILLLSSATSEAGHRDDQRAVQLLASAADSTRLRNLEAVHCEELIVSLFGDVTNVRWLANRIFTVTHGNPAQIMRVAHHLVQRGFCKYAAGTWTLPSSLDVEFLASAVDETLDPNLPHSAVELAQMLALGELTWVSVDECLQLSSHRNLKQLQADLQALTTAGIVSIDEDEVGLSRPGWEPVLLAELESDQRCELHLRIAKVLEQRPGTAFRRVQQLLLAGRVEESLDMLVAEIQDGRDGRVRDPETAFEYLQGLPKTWPDTYHTLIAACRSLQRPLRDRLGLQLELVAYATLSARFEGDCLRDVATQLRCDTGLDLIDELAGQVPDSELLTRALGAAQQRYDATPEQERGLALVAALTALGQLIIQAIGMAGRVFDAALLRSMPSLAPLAILSPALAVVQKNHESALAMLSGHSESARRAYLEIARRVAEPDGAGLEGSHRFHVHAASLWAAGMAEAVLGRPSALERATAIADNPLFAVSALRLRQLYSLARGDRIGAEHHRAQTELLQIQNCPPQLFEGTHAMQTTFGYAAIGDLVRAKQCLVDVEAMARAHEGWKPVVHCGRGAYQSARGDYVQAQLEFERGLAMMDVDHLAWTYCAGAWISALVQQDAFEFAVTQGRALLTRLEAAGTDYGIHHLLTPLALAESRFGLQSDALRHIQSAIDHLSAEGGGGVHLGQAYEVRAYVALYMADARAFSEYADACADQYRLGSRNNLLARHERLIVAARNTGLIEGSAIPEPDVRAGAEDVRTTVLTLFETARGAAERCERALRLLANAMRSTSGFLYLVSDGETVLAAQLGSPTPLLDMDERSTLLVREAVLREDMTETVTGTTGVTESWMEGESRFAAVVLSHPSEHGNIVTGVVWLARGSSALRRPPTLLVQALSKALYDAGDVVTSSFRLDGEP